MPDARTNWNDLEYYYEACDKEGRRIKGRLDGESARVLADKLRQMGFEALVICRRVEMPPDWKRLWRKLRGRPPLGPENLLDQTGRD